jgi:hypothetical protein
MRQSHRTLGAGERCVLVSASVSCFHAVKIISPVCMCLTLLFHAGAHIKAGEKRTRTSKTTPRPRSPEEAEDIAVALSLSFRRTNILNPCEITLLRLSYARYFNSGPECRCEERLLGAHEWNVQPRRSLWAGGGLCMRINELDVWLHGTAHMNMATQLKLYVYAKFCSMFLECTLQFCR